MKSSAFGSWAAWKGGRSLGPVGRFGGVMHTFAFGSAAVGGGECFFRLRAAHVCLTLGNREGREGREVCRGLLRAIRGLRGFNVHG